MGFTARTLSIGDYAFIDQDISNEEGTFSAGTEFEIIDLRVRHGQTFYDLRDHNQNLLFDVPLANLRSSRVDGEV